ncbi:hypothetical protein ACQ33O_00040 [Ferruginibacter sp. SUN002]|uniref:hypothetical protein n=1 Tax=Ferruginibacter sp. SUN002 TaxID=2937789 RepID=UPI003D362FB3
MRFFFLSILFIFSFLHSWSQSLSGEWKGSFTDDQNLDKEFPIKLYFQQDKDSSYNIYSYSKGIDTIVVCSMAYTFSGDSVFLQEKEILKPKKVNAVCLQKMFLKLKSNKSGYTLEGNWECLLGRSYGYGKIYFTKKKTVK